MAWKLASMVFPGGTSAARALTGKRIRVRNPLTNCATADPTRPGNQGAPISLRVGQEGFLGYPPEGALDMLTLAFPKAGTSARSLEDMMRRPFDAIRLNWPTFKANFEIDM